MNFKKSLGLIIGIASRIQTLTAMEMEIDTMNQAQGMQGITSPSNAIDHKYIKSKNITSQRKILKILKSTDIDSKYNTEIQNEIKRLGIEPNSLIEITEQIETFDDYERDASTTIPEFNPNTNFPFRNKYAQGPKYDDVDEVGTFVTERDVMENIFQQKKELESVNSLEKFQQWFSKLAPQYPDELIQLEFEEEVIQMYNFDTSGAEEFEHGQPSTKAFKTKSLLTKRARTDYYYSCYPDEKFKPQEGKNLSQAIVHNVKWDILLQKSEHNFKLERDKNILESQESDKIEKMLGRKTHSLTLRKKESASRAEEKNRILMDKKRKCLKWLDKIIEKENRERNKN